ncbi:MAG: glycosyltransferase [Ignavibacteria bacterium]|nr:glycosyltransferase [Ignavibacteria bacterium]
MRILIIGGVSDTSVGQSFERAARTLGHDVRFVDHGAAYRGPWFIRKVAWHVRGHLPARLTAFCHEVQDVLAAYHPDVVLTTGVAPVDRATLESARRIGARCINYSTDDPFSPHHRASWFFDALPGYDLICSPRRAAIADYASVTAARVAYVPFAYDETLFFTPEHIDDARRRAFACDVVFVGGADGDRAPYIGALLREGMTVGLYGSYWDRFAETRGHGRGQIGIEDIRLATACARIALCLVRRANRDGNSMRTYEVPSIGACMLTEWTPDHENLFGAEGEAVRYFRSIPEMIEKARWLLDRPEECARLAARAKEIVREGGHTYRHRLETILALLPAEGVA